MAEEDISLRIIRTTIFSIVVPHKEPCSTHKIRMEYKDMEEEEIPYADYGHRNLDEFLLQHPQLNGMMQDGKWVFTAKMSERSANIQALVKGQKSKKKKRKGNNPFNRNFNRSSGRSTLGHGDVRRTNGSQSFSNNTQSYRPSTPGAYRPPVSTSFNSKNAGWGSQQWNNSRPSAGSTSNAPSFPRPAQPWAGNQPRKFTPILSSTRSPFNTEASSSARQENPQEGMRRFNTILFKCKGSVTLRVFCRLYAQEFHVAFGADELKRHFNTADLAEIINKYGNDKILVSPTPDGSVMFTDSQVLEAHTKAARDLEEKKKNCVVIEPEKKHCAIPSLKVMFDEMTEMLVDSFPQGIPLEEITNRYEKKAGVRVEPIAVFSLQWNELIEKKFNSRVRIDSGKAVLTPTYIKANNLQARPTGERKKQELVTLADLGIIFVDETSQDEDEEDDEEECQSETASLAGVEVNDPKTSWRATPTGCESMCSSVSSSVQALNASPNETHANVVCEEVNELADRMRTVKMTMDQDSPRLMVTITRSSASPLKGNLMAVSNGIEESAVVKKEENPNIGHPSVTMSPKGVLTMAATGAYGGFSVSVDTKNTYAVKATCNSPYYRIMGNIYFTTGRPKMLQVLRENGPKGETCVTIDFVKMAEGDKRSAVDVMKTTTPHFTAQYAFRAQ